MADVDTRAKFLVKFSGSTTADDNVEYALKQLKCTGLSVYCLDGVNENTFVVYASENILSERVGVYSHGV